MFNVVLDPQRAVGKSLLPLIKGVYKRNSIIARCFIYVQYLCTLHPAIMQAMSANRETA